MRRARLRCWSAAIALFAVLLACAGQASAAPSTALPGSVLRHGGPTASASTLNQDDPNAITFDDYPLETTITDQYASRGVVFDSDVFISVDSANPTEPVLSGSPRFYGDIVGHFTVPGTTVPATVDGFSLDIGYINDRNSVEIDYYDNAGNLIGSTRAQSYGINEVDVTYRGVASFRVRAVEYEAAGFAIDNLVIHTAATGIHPTRMAELGDSYSSGEGLVPDKTGLRYDCGTDLHRDRYVEGTTVLAFARFWDRDSCQTASGSRRKPKDLQRRKAVVYENLCHRHGRAYPNQIRSQLGIAGANSIFVACSGATTANVGARGVAVPEFPDSPPGVHGGEPQLQTVSNFAAAGGPPDLITIGIGGNDANFASIVEECVFHTCSDPDYASRALSTVNGSMYRHVEETFAGLRTTFPGATIVAFGYPSVVDDPNQTCARAFRIGSDELSWIKYTLLPSVNDAIKDAATEAGVVYVDITAATVGHGICSPEPWINGVRLGDDNWFVGNESFHPNQTAHDAIARLFMDHYTDGAGNLLVSNPQPSEPIRFPTGPEIHLGDIGAGAVHGCGAGCARPVPCIQGCPIHIQGGGFDPGATMNVTLESEPVSLGLIAADANGNVDATLRGPKRLPAGLHSVTLDGLMPDGTREHAVQSFWVYGRTKARPRLALRHRGSAAAVRSLTVRRAPKGARVDIVCVASGKRRPARAAAGLKVGRRHGCPFSHRRFRIRGGSAKRPARKAGGHRKHGAQNYGRLFRRPLAPRTVLRVAVSTPKLAGRSLQATITAKGKIQVRRRCTYPGEFVPVSCRPK